ncbi:MAG: hypothetical protein JNN17_26285 [Verrucomicrobiaceae bacterium]|nr:hypothetical protein [Verrucomicrobiaceae bacterium]
MFTILAAVCMHSDLEAEPATPLPRQEVRERVDRLMRSLPTLTDEQRKRTISDLYEVWTSKTPGENEAIVYFGYAVTANPDGTRSLSPQADRNAVLSKVIPILISAIDDSEKMNSKAWWVLIALQPSCPPPKREVWEAWWRDSGSKQFVPKNSPSK